MFQRPSRSEGMSEGQYRPRSILVNALLLPFPVDVPVSMWATRERSVGVPDMGTGLEVKVLRGASW